MKKVEKKEILIWLLLNVAIIIFMDLAMFMQTTPNMKKAGFGKKLASAEFWATCEWMFLIPANRIGNKFLTAAQVSLSSFVFDFIGQIGTNTLWLKIPTTLDDYAAMIIIFGGMTISAYKLFG